MTDSQDSVAVIAAEMGRESASDDLPMNVGGIPTIYADVRRWAKQLRAIAALQAQQGEAVAWRHRTPYGDGYSFASERVMKDMTDWLTPSAGSADPNDGHAESCHCLQPGDRECNCHKSYGFVTAEDMDEAEACDLAVRKGAHVRHIGGGMLALYEGETFDREIGVTPGWKFQDRDEFIMRYNAAARRIPTTHR